MQIKIYILLLISLFLVSCSTLDTTPQPRDQEFIEYLADTQNCTYQDSVIRISISPNKNSRGDYRSFDLKAKNISNRDIKIDWDDTYFIQKGVAKGGFIMSGERYVDKNVSKKATLILPKTEFTTLIMPSENVDHQGYPRESMTVGLYGAYIKIIGSGYSKHIKLTANITGIKKVKKVNGEIITIGSVAETDLGTSNVPRSRVSNSAIRWLSQ